MAGDAVGDEARPRQLDHRADGEVELVGRLLAGHPLDQAAHQLELLLVGHERDHDLELRRLPRALADGQRGPHDRPRLHLVDLRVQDPEPHAAG